MSDGLYKSLEEATRTDQVNKDLAQMAVEQVGTDIYSVHVSNMHSLQLLLIWMMLMLIILHCFNENLITPQIPHVTE